MSVAAVAVVAVADHHPHPPPVPLPVARDEHFHEIRDVVALPEARVLTPESQRTESPPEPSDRRDSIESIGFTTRKRSSHVLLLLGVAYTGNHKPDWTKLTAAEKAEQSAHEHER